MKKDYIKDCTNKISWIMIVIGFVISILGMIFMAIESLVTGLGIFIVGMLFDMVGVLALMIVSAFSSKKSTNNKFRSGDK